MTASRFDGLLGRLAGDARVYPHQLDLITDRVLLVDLPLTAQSAASFLDQRALQPGTDGAWFPWAQFSAVAAGAPAAAPAYIFHVGHCGSTLLSRLVAAAGAGRALREPLPLRTLAIDAANAPGGAAFLDEAGRIARLRLFERLWPRGGAVVKATSMCNGLIDQIDSAAPVAFVFVKPETHLAALLSGANAFADLRGFAEMRVRRLSAMTDAAGPLSRLGPGALAALSWLIEAASIAASKRSVHAVDFDVFLADPVRALGALCAHLGFPAAAPAVSAALSSDLMRRYAKAPEHPYDARVRAGSLAQAHSAHRDEIRAGLEFLGRVAGSFAAGEAALDRFGG